MLRRIATVLVLAGVALAQAAPGAAPQKPAAKAAPKPAAKAKASPAGAASTGAVGPDTPVMYVSGLCALQGANIPAQPVTSGPGAPAAAKGQCVRAVTKAQFERLITGLGPRAQGAPRAQLAEYYARALVIDNESRKLGLEKDPEVASAIWMGRVAALGQALHAHFQKLYSNIPEAEIAAYYNEHKQDFDEATVKRVVIPKPQQPAKEEKAEDKSKPEAAAAAKPATPEVPYEQQVAARKALAEKMLERAKAGEDLNKLQKEAFEAAKIEGSPEAEGAAIHRGQLPKGHDEKVFALQGGQITPLIEEPTAFMFYKVEKRRVVPLAEVSGEIKRELLNRKEDDAVKKLFSVAPPVLNPAYFAESEKKPGAAPAAEGAKPAPPAGETPKTEQPEAPKAAQPEPPPQPKQENPGEPPK